MADIAFETPDKRLSIAALICVSVSLLAYIASVLVAFRIIQTDTTVGLVLTLIGIVPLLAGAILLRISTSRKSGSSKMNKITNAFVVASALIIFAKIFIGV